MPPGNPLAQQPLNLADGMLLISMVAWPFRPEQESEADRDATEWMMMAGYDPRELARLLNTWDQRQTQEMPWMKFIPSMVKSHPNPGRRAQEILVIAEPLRKQYPGAKHVGLDNLANRIPKSQGKFLNRRASSGRPHNMLCGCCTTLRDML